MVSHIVVGNYINTYKQHKNAKKIIPIVYNYAIKLVTKLRKRVNK